MKLKTTLSILALAVLATTGCNGTTPTEPAFDEEMLAADSSASTAASSAIADPADKRRGADDPAGDDRGGRGRGTDDGAGASGSGRGGRGGMAPANPTQQPPRTGQQFESTVSSVSGNTVLLGNGTRVTVNAQTQWNARGDLRSVAQVANAVRAGRSTRVEGRGTRQANGAFAASTIKAEVDD